MDVYFNELSLRGVSALTFTDVQRVALLYRSLMDYGIRLCRVSKEDYAALMGLVGRVPGMRPEATGFLYAFLKIPYESSDVEARQDDYFGHDWFCDGAACYGLALAYIVDSLSLSIADAMWDRTTVKVTRDGNPVEVRNLFGEETLSAHSGWLEGVMPVEPTECDVRPEEKDISLRDDHGKDELLKYAKKLVRSPYVLKVVNSLPFNPHDRRFIHAIRDGGIVEIVLPWTDQGLGLVVQTTGRSRRETEEIAKDLKRNYGGM